MTFFKRISSLGNTSAANRFEPFTSNKLIRRFNEFIYFESCSIIKGSHAAGRFGGFFNCQNLEEITLPETLKTFEDSAFRDCPSLHSRDLKNVTSIGRFALYNTGLYEIVLSEGTATIGNAQSIYGSSDTAYIDFPSTMTNISNYNFGVNKAPKVVVVRATTPPTLGTAGNSNPASIYVPAASIDSYKTTSPWSDQASKLLPIEGTWYETHRSLEP